VAVYFLGWRFDKPYATPPTTKVQTRIQIARRRNTPKISSVLSLV